MSWHAQIKSLVLRGFDDASNGGGFAAHEPFVAIAQADLMGGGRAFLHSALRTDGQQLSRKDWRELAQVLREHGVQTVTVDRDGLFKEWTTERWARG
jgi:hypothetical protein